MSPRIVLVLYLFMIEHYENDIISSWNWKVHETAKEKDPQVHEIGWHQLWKLVEKNHGIGWRF